MEVEHDREPKSHEVSNARIVHEVLASEEARFPDEHLHIVKPEHAPDDLSKVEGVVVETLKGTVEVSLCDSVDLNGDERIVPNIRLNI